MQRASKVASSSGGVLLGLVSHKEKWLSEGWSDRYSRPRHTRSRLGCAPHTRRVRSGCLRQWWIHSGHHHGQFRRCGSQRNRRRDRHRNRSQIQCDHGFEGYWSLGPLNPGDYDVVVTAPGFQKTDVKTVIHTGTATSGNFKLSVGSSAETIEVNAGAVQLNTDQAGVSDVITAQQIKTSAGERPQLPRFGPDSARRDHCRAASPSIRRKQGIRLSPSAASPAVPPASTLTARTSLTRP